MLWDFEDNNDRILKIWRASDISIRDAKAFIEELSTDACWLFCILVNYSHFCTNSDYFLKFNDICFSLLYDKFKFLKKYRKLIITKSRKRENVSVSCFILFFGYTSIFELLVRNACYFFYLPFIFLP